MNIPETARPCNLRLTPRQGCLRAMFDLEYGGIVIIEDFRIVQQPGQRAFIQAPCWVLDDVGGKVTYHPQLKLSPTDRLRLEHEVFASFETLRKGAPNE